VPGEARTGALLAKAVAGRADALPAHAALRAATLAGARALGLEARIGSLQRGKDADLVAISLDRPELTPCYDPVSHLLYCASREDVRHVWVQGRPIVIDRRLVRVDMKSLESLAFLWHTAMLEQISQT
jgi:5-methylthioadenosine/S-adenosylhomocysteine deaminase